MLGQSYCLPTLSSGPGFELGRNLIMQGLVKTNSSMTHFNLKSTGSTEEEIEVQKKNSFFPVFPKCKTPGLQKFQITHFSSFPFNISFHFELCYISQKNVGNLHINCDPVSGFDFLYLAVDSYISLGYSVPVIANLLL